MNYQEVCELDLIKEALKEITDEGVYIEGGYDFRSGVRDMTLESDNYIVEVEFEVE